MRVIVYNYKNTFWTLLFVWGITLSIGLYLIWDINKTLNEIHKHMDDNRIQVYVDAGWVPPLEYIRHKTRAKKKEKFK